MILMHALQHRQATALEQPKTGSTSPSEECGFQSIFLGISCIWSEQSLLRRQLLCLDLRQRTSLRRDGVCVKILVCVDVKFSGIFFPIMKYPI